MKPAPPRRSQEPNVISRRTLVTGFLAGSALSYLAPDTAGGGLGAVLSKAGTPPTMIIPTMKGPVRCDSLGTTLMHEHLLWFGGPRLEDSGYSPIPDEKRAESVEFAVSLLNDAVRDGDSNPRRPYSSQANRPLSADRRADESEDCALNGFLPPGQNPQALAEMKTRIRWTSTCSGSDRGHQRHNIRAGIIKIAA